MRHVTAIGIKKFLSDRSKGMSSQCATNTEDRSQLEILSIRNTNIRTSIYLIIPYSYVLILEKKVHQFFPMWKYVDEHTYGCYYLVLFCSSYFWLYISFSITDDGNDYYGYTPCRIFLYITFCVERASLRWTWRDGTTPNE